MAEAYQVNRLHRSRNHPHTFLLLCAVVVFFAAGSSYAGDTSRPSEDLLRGTYQGNQARLATNSFGLPLFLDSSERNDRVQVDVYGIFDYPFGSVVDALGVPANWCDIVSLHPNVKACTHRKLPDAWRLTFYLGRKVYQRPEETHQVIYRYRNVEQRQAYLDIVLDADAGPFGTKDHQIRFEALPLDAGRTFVHVGYAYRDSMAIRLAEKVYFATLGSGKIGFTVTGTDRNGRPVYIGGARGAIERNAVRYYFAINSFMKTLDNPEASRFSRRSSEWYDLTDRYRPQLFELEKKDYLTLKTTEHANQVMLQRGVGTAPP
jgi:hypothetical protein